MAGKWPFACFQIAENSAAKWHSVCSFPGTEELFQLLLVHKDEVWDFFLCCSLISFPLTISFSFSLWCYSWDQKMHWAFINQGGKWKIPPVTGAHQKSPGVREGHLLNKIKLQRCRATLQWRSVGDLCIIDAQVMRWSSHHADYLHFLCLITVWKWDHHQAGSWSGRRQRRWAVQSVIW